MPVFFSNWVGSGDAITTRTSQICTFKKVKHLVLLSVFQHHKHSQQPSIAHATSQLFSSKKWPVCLKTTTFHFESIAHEHKITCVPNIDPPKVAHAQTLFSSVVDICHQINEISFELRMETNLMLLVFAVLLCCYSSSETKAWTLLERYNFNFSGLSFTTIYIYCKSFWLL